MAASNTITARAGKFTFGPTSSGATANILGSFRDITLSVSASNIEIRDSDSSGWTERRPGFKAWTATLSASLLSTNAPLGQDDFRTALSSGTRQYFIFNTSTVTGDNPWAAKGWGYVSGWDWNGDVTDVWLHNFSVDGDGKITVT